MTDCIARQMELEGLGKRRNIAPVRGEPQKTTGRDHEDITQKDALARLCYAEEPRGVTPLHPWSDRNSDATTEPEADDNCSLQCCSEDTRARDLKLLRRLRTAVTRSMARHPVTATDIDAQRRLYVFLQLRKHRCSCQARRGEHYHCALCGRAVVYGEYQVQVRWNRQYVECSDAPGLELDPDTGELLREPDDSEAIPLWECCVGSELVGELKVVCADCVKKGSQTS